MLPLASGPLSAVALAALPLALLALLPARRAGAAGPPLAPAQRAPRAGAPPPGRRQPPPGGRPGPRLKALGAVAAAAAAALWLGLSFLGSPGGEAPQAP
ncbi:MAG: hypothetical protein LBW85_00315, partial [Deltaproteobacteria bacterium]|nr:hypothetical protein [Deltaproteobacteria bacterium]